MILEKSVMGKKSLTPDYINPAPAPQATVAPFAGRARFTWALAQQ